MCCLMTFAVPASFAGRVAPQVLDESGAPLYEVRQFASDGGSHTYPEGFTTYSVMGVGEDCSCDVTMKQLELRRYFSGLALEAGELQYLIHFHSEYFASEQFAILKEVQVPVDRLSKRHDEEDIRYIIQTAPLTSASS